jgi:hypothetical protein
VDLGFGGVRCARAGRHRHDPHPEIRPTSASAGASATAFITAQTSLYAIYVNAQGAAAQCGESGLQLLLQNRHRIFKLKTALES